MKRISNVICTVLIVIGAIIAIMYASYEQPNTVKDTYGNGVYTVDENGNQAYIQYFDIGKTDRKGGGNAYGEQMLYEKTYCAVSYGIAAVFCGVCSTDELCKGGLQQ